jgi:hypothetical protein
LGPPQFGCGGYRGARVNIAVRDGVATPATIDLDVAAGGQGVLPAIAPIIASDGMPVAVDVLSPAGPVSAPSTVPRVRDRSLPDAPHLESFRTCVLSRRPWI